MVLRTAATKECKNLMAISREKNGGSRSSECSSDNMVVFMYELKHELWCVALPGTDTHGVFSAVTEVRASSA